jgi:hypothetical protein
MRHSELFIGWLGRSWLGFTPREILQTAKVWKAIRGLECLSTFSFWGPVLKNSGQGWGPYSVGLWVRQGSIWNNDHCPSLTTQAFPSPNIGITVKNCEEPETLPLKANKLVCQGVMDAGWRHETSVPETKDNTQSTVVTAWNQHCPIASSPRAVWGAYLSCVAFPLL